MTHSSQLTVRTNRDGRVKFLVDAGQEGVEFVRGPIAPLQRFWSGGDAVAVVLSRADLLHTINAVPLLVPRRFVVTFEDYLPRTPGDRPVPWLEKILTRKLLNPRCEKIIAISEYALRQFKVQHQGSSYLDALLRKTSIVYPAVPVRVDRPKEFDAQRPVRLLAVGFDWLRKGFPAVVWAHKELVSRGVQVETTIVSILRWRTDDYVGPPSVTLHDRYMEELRTSGVNHVPFTENDKVRRLMSEADLFLHPTLHDTFGYVIIEALAGATPVLATDTCAIPEMVTHDQCGLLLPMENDPVVGKWVWLYRTREPGYEGAYEAFVNDAGLAIANHVEALVATPENLYRLSEGALQRARERFDSSLLRAQLQEVYRSYR